MDGHRGGSGKVTAQVCRHSVLRFAGSRYEYALVTPELAVIRVKPYSLALRRLPLPILPPGHPAALETYLGDLARSQKHSRRHGRSGNGLWLWRSELYFNR